MGNLSEESGRLNPQLGYINPVTPLFSMKQVGIFSSFRPVNVFLLILISRNTNRYIRSVFFCLYVLVRIYIFKFF